MDKCKWFGHKWSQYKQIPRPTFKGLKSIVGEQERKCKRCGKIEREMI